MPNDAKLGMVVGMGLVIATAIFFVHKDVAPMPLSAQTARTTAAASSATSAARVRPTQQVSGTSARQNLRKSESDDRDDDAPGVTVSQPRIPPGPDQDP